MRFIVVMLALLLTGLFIPSYELNVLEEPVTGKYHAVESFLLFKSRCSDKKREKAYIGLKPVCIKTTFWGSMQGISGRYRDRRELVLN